MVVRLILKWPALFRVGYFYADIWEMKMLKRIISEKVLESENFCGIIEKVIIW